MFVEMAAWCNWALQRNMVPLVLKVQNLIFSFIYAYYPYNDMTLQSQKRQR